MCVPCHLPPQIDAAASGLVKFAGLKAKTKMVIYAETKADWQARAARGGASFVHAGSTEQRPMSPCRRSASLGALACESPA